MTFKWKQTLPEKIKENKKITNTLKEIIEDVVYPLLEHTRRQMKEIIQTINQNLIQSFFRNLNCTFINYIDTEISKISAEDMSRLE